MRVRTLDRELLTSKGWINANAAIDLPYEEARHLIGLKRVIPVDPATPPEDEAMPRPANGSIRKNNAMPHRMTR